MISCRRRVGVTGRGGFSAARAGVAVSASPARLYDVKTRIVLTTRMTRPNTQMGIYQSFSSLVVNKSPTGFQTSPQQSYAETPQSLEVSWSAIGVPVNEGFSKLHIFVDISESRSQTK